MSKDKLYKFGILVVALAATLGSLYFSEVKGYLPCQLCWYQRIAMYPIIPIMVVGILKNDRSLPFYVLPLGFFGLLVGGYHNLIQYKFINHVAAVCGIGTDCGASYLNIFGFVEIPLLSIIAFAVIIILSLLTIKEHGLYETGN